VNFAAALPNCLLYSSLKLFLIVFGFSLNAIFYLKIFSVLNPFADAAVVFVCLEVASKFFWKVWFYLIGVFIAVSYLF
jgi:hypothetical protein